MPAKMNSCIGRTAIDEKVRMKLWAISGGRCEICNRLLYSDLHYGNDGNFGEFAHIHAVSNGGPRHKVGMTTEEKNNIENLMLLCEEHHHMIDSNPENYSDGILLKRKRQHEERIRTVTEIAEEQSCRIAGFFSNIDHAEIYSSDRLLRAAAISAGLYPKQEPTILLHKDAITRYIPSKEIFELKAHELERQFKEWFDAFKAEDAIALFALAPQPLLFKLGTLINDQYNVQVFQCHRTGHKWAWKQDADSVDYILSITRTVSEPANVALVMDLSAEIVDTRILSAVGEQTKIYHLTIATPNRNFVQTPEIQNQFVVKFREAMEAIKNENPQIDCIRVFMAMPASLAVRAGMDFMPKADVPLVLYEQATADDGFFEALTIGG